MKPSPMFTTLTYLVNINNRTWNFPKVTNSIKLCELCLVALTYMIYDILLETV